MGFFEILLGKMGDVTNGGQIVLFASHNMGAINQFCPTSIWIHKGRMKKIGATDPIISAYLNGDNRYKSSGYSKYDDDFSKESQIREAGLRHKEGIVTQKFSCNESITLELLFQVYRKLPRLYGYLEIIKTDGTRVLVSDSFDTVLYPINNLAVDIHIPKITILVKTLAPDVYNTYLNFISDRAKSLNVDSPGIFYWVNLDGFTLNGGNTRLGFFSTLLFLEVNNLLNEQVSNK